MTETCGKFNQHIRPDENRAFNELNFAGMGEHAKIVFGPECEFFICKIQQGSLRPISLDEAKEFMAWFQKHAGAELHQEAIASHFELNYGPMELKDFREKFEDYFKSVRALYRLADIAGYRVIPSSHAPHIKGADDVIDQLVDRDRIRNIVPTARKYLGDSVVKFANLTAGIHVSSGYRDMEHFYTDLRRTYYLSPFIYALSNNGFPFWKGMADAEGVIPRLAIIEQFASEPKGRTGIDPIFFEAVDGEDYLKRYIARMMAAPLFCFYQRGLTLTEIMNGRSEPGLRKIDELGATPENPISFSDLEKRGLNTLSNLQFAASSWWYGVKVQDIPGTAAENGLPYKRLEDRIWNAGTWQLSSALLTRALMTQEPDCGREIDTLLAEFGFHPDGPATCPESAAYLKQSTREAAANGGRCGLDFAFGKGTAQEFGRQFVTILKKYAARHGLEDYIAPMEYITATNNTDSRILHQICRTPEDVTAFMEKYDVAAVPNPRKCFGMLLEEGNLPDPSSTTARAGQKDHRTKGMPGSGGPHFKPS